ncbi:hypothetical protein ABK040_008437 [Willaertia magna]
MFTFITGSPGIGKSFLLRNLISNFQENNEIKLFGFITSEIKVENQRVGFSLETFHNKRKATLASKINEENFKEENNNGKKLFGKNYLVHINEMENVIHEEIESIFTEIDKQQIKKEEGFDDNKIFIIIDEIGKMECLSNLFVNDVINLIKKLNKTLNLCSNKNIICLMTIPLNHQKVLPNEIVNIIKQLKEKRKDITLTKLNRDEIAQNLTKDIATALNVKID